MPQAIAIIIADMQTSRLGLPSSIGHRVQGQTVLQHVVGRLSQVQAVRQIVIVHPVGQMPLDLLDDAKSGNKPVKAFADEQGLTDVHHLMRIAARKWSLTAWRGGIAGAGCYDELLPASAMVAAMKEHRADSALIVGGDWLLVDPQNCQAVLERHVSNPQAMAMTFTQSPPGLCGLAISLSMLDDMAQKNALFGHVLSYHPASPQADPIGKDVCVQIDPVVRSSAHRYIYDTQRSRQMIDLIATKLGNQLVTSDAKTIVDVCRQTQQGQPLGCLPQQVTMELTPRRSCTGPILPQAYVNLPRADMDVNLAKRLFEQLGQVDDLALSFGGLGDALVHDRCIELIHAAKEAGIFGIAVYTDLLVEPAMARKLFESPIDVLCVCLNADTAKLYEKMMGVDRYKSLLEHLHTLLPKRVEPLNSQTDGQRLGQGLPWVVPHMVKTKDTLADMETFFDRWMHFANQAVILPSTTGCGLMPMLGPVDMSPPKRFACRQLPRRLSILSNGLVAQCDQDWLGKAPLGDANDTALVDMLENLHQRNQQHQRGQWQDLSLCNKCSEWHRP